MRRFLFPLLLLLLLISGAWSAWQWLRPYEPGNASPWLTQQVTVRRDHDFAWVAIELALRSDEPISSPPLSRLVSDEGRHHEPADARVSSDGKTCQIRYWLSLAELEKAWHLQVPPDQLRIKHSGGITLENGQTRTFRQPRW